MRHHLGVMVSSFFNLTLAAWDCAEVERLCADISNMVAVRSYGAGSDHLQLLICRIHVLPMDYVSSIHRQVRMLRIGLIASKFVSVQQKPLVFRTPTGSMVFSNGNVLETTTSAVGNPADGTKDLLKSS